MFYCPLCKTKIRSKCVEVRCKNCNLKAVRVSRRMLPVADALSDIGLSVSGACEYTYGGGLDSLGSCIGYYNILYIEFNKVYSESIFREFDNHKLCDYWEHQDITDGVYSYTQLTFAFDFPARSRDKQVLQAVKAVSKCAIDELLYWAEGIKNSNANAVLFFSGLL